MERAGRVMVLFIMLGLTTAAFLYKQNKTISDLLKNEQGLEVGEDAFMFETLAIDGERISLSSKNVVLIFFNTSCYACKLTAPRWQQLYDKYASDNVLVVGVSWESESATRKFMSQNGLTLPVIVRESQSIIQKYRIRTSPQIVMINQSGKIAYYSHFGTGVRRALNHVEQMIAASRHVENQS